MDIVVVSSHTSSLFWFRMDMMQEFIKSGHNVIAFGSESEDDWKVRFKNYNIEYKQLYVKRNSINLIADLKTFFQLYCFFKKNNINKVFLYQAKTIIYGSMAAKLAGLKDIYSLMAGLGSIYRGEGFKNKLMKFIISYQYKIAFLYNKKVIFQNVDDRDEFIASKIVTKNKTEIINGSGVNLNKFQIKPLPDKLTFLFIGRLIKDKGIVEFLEACKFVKKKYKDINCILVGPFDTNPTALLKKDLDEYIENNIIEYYGEQSDIPLFISKASILVLPSYHEGTPKTVLEAMAMGRLIITTNAPGCKETVVDGLNGFLIPVKDTDALIDKMEYLINNPTVIPTMGVEGRKIAELKYDVNKVNSDILRIMFND